MGEVTKISVCKKLYITERTNSIDEILCKALVGDFDQRVLGKEENIEDCIEQYDVIVISAISKNKYFSIYKKCYQEKKQLLQLEYLDIKSDIKDEELLHNIVFYNLELFRCVNLRSKCNLYKNVKLFGFNKEDFICNQGLDFGDLPPRLLLFLYKIVALNNIQSVADLCDYLKSLNCKNKIEINILILKFCKYYNATSNFIQNSINYYLIIKYKDDTSKETITSIITFLYSNVDSTIIKKLNNNLTPLICYYTQTDRIGDKLSILDNLVNKVYSRDRNHITAKILIYSYIHKNEVYIKKFSPLLEYPKHKKHQLFNNVLNKIKTILDSRKYDDFDVLEIIKGTDEYLTFLLSGYFPSEPATIFNEMNDQ